MTAIGTRAYGLARNLLVLLLALVVGTGLASPLAASAHDEPKRARSVKANLVTAYRPCTEPNTVVDGGMPFPACSPPVRSDPECGFQGGLFRAGYAKAAGVTTPRGDFRMSYTAKGLNPGCEGHKLCAVAQIRITTDRCVWKPCTFDLPQWYVDTATGCCIVQNGECRVSTSVNSEILGTLAAGEKTGIEILGCGLKRLSPPSPPEGLTFSCGVLAP